MIEAKSVSKRYGETQVVRDARQRVLERGGGQDPGCGIDEGVQRSAALLRRHVLGDHNLVYRPASAPA